MTAAMATPKNKIAIIGGGAAGIMCACHLDTDIYEVTIYEKTNRLGRKLLVAGEGGFNLTFKEPVSEMISKYQPSEFVSESILKFDNSDLRQYFENIGIETFVGSSHRVFPIKEVKPYQVVDRLVDKIKSKNISIHVNSEWKKWTVRNGKNIHTINDKEHSDFDYVIFALGGGSWKKTGSDGSWLRKFTDQGIQCFPFEASNCTWLVDWTESFIIEEEGKPIKNITTKVGNNVVRGEALITKEGIEGGAVYAQSYFLREVLAKTSPAEMFIDFKPNLSLEQVTQRLSRRKKSIKHTLLNDLKIGQPAVRLINTYVDKESYTNPESLAAIVKNFNLKITGSGPIAKSISTTGGIALQEVNSCFELYNHTSHFAIGEMLNWDAPTGGYLLQFCFSMGVRLARHLNEFSRK